MIQKRVQKLTLSAYKLISRKYVTLHNWYMHLTQGSSNFYLNTQDMSQMSSSNTNVKLMTSSLLEEIMEKGLHRACLQNPSTI